MATIKQINKWMQDAHRRVADIDPCTIAEARSICVEVAGSDPDGAQLLMAMRIMGHLVETEDGTAVASRDLP